MSDLDERAIRAVASPIAPPRELDEIEQRARRHAKHRRTRGIAIGAAFTVAALLGMLALVRDDSRSPRVAVIPTTSKTDRTTRSQLDAEYSGTNLVHDLVNAGMKVSPAGASAGGVFETEAQLLCVNESQIRVYEYPDRAARLGVSKAISRDGSRVYKRNGSMTMVKWIGPPHFYARGRIIVLALQTRGTDQRVLRVLPRILGATLSPDAPNNDSPIDGDCKR
jgi:hypothetical protein